ncbi:MAG: phosphatidate cytidylyltransferase [Flavobacteriaceae bacterium]|nr:phosphatidate cytidylyltransferase [Flavobacteriaceae bacterium]
MGENIKRFLSGLIYTALLVGTLFFSKNLFLIVVTLFGIICLLEFSKLRYFKGGIIYPILVFLTYYLHFINEDQNIVMGILLITIIISCVLIIKLLMGSHNKINLLGNYTLSIFYIITGIIFITLIPTIKAEYDYRIILATLIIMWTNDTFAYLVGKNFGKRKLYEKISPKKTIEGLAGGFVFSLIAASVLFVTSKNNLNLIEWLSLATIIVITGTLGDLVQSQFKRQVNIKDSGTILPGHGGIYDRLDSIIFAAPFVYSYLYIFSNYVS